MKPERMFISIILSACIFIILTLPQWTLIYFNFGIEYNMNLLIIIAIVVGLGTSIFLVPFLEKKKWL